MDGEMVFTEDHFSELDITLSLLRDQMDQGERPAVSLIWFEADEKKAGGAYRSVEGIVKKLDEYERKLILEDGKSIPLEMITELYLLEGRNQ